MRSRGGNVRGGWLWKIQLWRSWEVRAEAGDVGPRRRGSFALGEVSWHPARGGRRRGFVDDDLRHPTSRRNGLIMGGRITRLTETGTDFSDLVTGVSEPTRSKSYIEPGGGPPGDGTLGPATKRRSRSRPEQFCPVFGSQTFDQSTGSEWQPPCTTASTPEAVTTTNPPSTRRSTRHRLATDKFIGLRYSQSAVGAPLEPKRDLIMLQEGEQAPNSCSSPIHARPKRAPY